MVNKHYLAIDTRYVNDWALYDRSDKNLIRYSQNVRGAWDLDCAAFIEEKIAYIVLLNDSSLARKLFGVVDECHNNK